MTKSKIKEITIKTVGIASLFLSLFLLPSCGRAADIIITPATLEIAPSRMAPESEAAGSEVPETAAELILIEDTGLGAAPETESGTPAPAVAETGTEPEPPAAAAPETADTEVTAQIVAETTKAMETAAKPETASPPETAAAAPVTAPPETEAPIPDSEAGGIFVILNTNSRKYHTHPDCSYAVRISEENRQERYLSVATLEKSGYTICSFCAKADAKPETAAPVKIQTPAEAAPSEGSASQGTRSGKSAKETAAEELSALPTGDIHVAVNVNSKKYHTSDSCSYASAMKAENRLDIYVSGTAGLDALGYSLCSFCAKAAEASNAPHAVPPTETAKTEETAPPETVPAETAPAETAPPENAAPETAAPAAAEETASEPEVLPGHVPEADAAATERSPQSGTITVIINKSSKTFHISDSCSAVSSMKEDNKLVLEVEGEAGILALIEQGYKPCGKCAKAYRQG